VVLILVRWDDYSDYSQYMEKYKMFQTTNQQMFGSCSRNKIFQVLWIQSEKPPGTAT
jgi:hypothetical protein